MNLDDCDEHDADTASTDTVPSLPPFSPITSSSVTSYDVDDLMSIRSDTLSPQPSVLSITSSLRQRIYRQEYGRERNNFSEVYSLPADEEEIGRLDKQHEMFKILMGGLSFAPLSEVLAPSSSDTKAVLDLGCGSGAWLMEVARTFPHCSAVGVDLIPLQTSSIPPNCRCEVDDINLGLEHFYNIFDVVHARFICSGIKDYCSLIAQITHCLRPHGLIEVMEYDFRLYHPDMTLLPPWSATGPASEIPYFCRWLATFRHAAQQKGGDIDAALHMHRWIQEQGYFDEIVLRESWCPTGPWEHDWSGAGKHSRELGAMMQDDIQAFLKGGRPLLLSSGISPEELDELEMNSHRELEECKIPMLVKIQTVYARKKAA